MLATALTKLCSRCYLELPVSHFQKRSKHGNELQSRCAKCHREAERDRYRRGKPGRIARFAKDVVDANRDQSQLLFLVRRLCQDFADVTELGTLWKKAFDSADRAGRHYVKFRLLAATLDLVIIGEQIQRERLRDASDAELDHQVSLKRETLIARLIQSSPEAVLRAAEQLGWRVIPPSSVDNTE